MANEITKTSYGESSTEDRERSGYRVGESFDRADPSSRYSYGSSIDGSQQPDREEQQRGGYDLPDAHYEAPPPFDLSTTKPNGTHVTARADEKGVTPRRRPTFEGGKVLRRLLQHSPSDVTLVTL